MPRPCWHQAMYRPAPRPRTRATGNPWPTAPTHPWSASQAIPKIGLIDLSDWENDHDPISTAPNRTLPIFSHQPTIGLRRHQRPPNKITKRPADLEKHPSQRVLEGVELRGFEPLPLTLPARFRDALTSNVGEPAGKPVRAGNGDRQEQRRSGGQVAVLNGSSSRRTDADQVYHYLLVAVRKNEKRSS